MEKNDNTAKVLGRNLPISTKQSIEIGTFIKGKTIAKAKIMLANVIAKKVAVPFTRFNKDMGHKKGNIAAGRYPINASTEVLNLLNSAESNAANKGLGSDLFIKMFVANQGTGQWHYGRQRRRRMKRTHIEIIVEEMKKKQKPKQKTSKVETKETPEAKVTSKEQLKKTPKVEKKEKIQKAESKAQKEEIKK
ncbi:MAG: 50S ribosomal protein L22 [archaeon]